VHYLLTKAKQTQTTVCQVYLGPISDDVYCVDCSTWLMVVLNARGMLSARVVCKLDALREMSMRHMMRKIQLVMHTSTKNYIDLIFLRIFKG